MFRWGAVGIAAVCCACGPSQDSATAGRSDESPTVLSDAGSTPQEDVSDDWPAAWVQLEDTMFALVNTMRETGGDCPSGFKPAVAALSFHPLLRQAARAHSLDMGTQHYFEHIDLDGNDPFERMRAAGYPGFAAGENIAAGNATAEATFQQWVNSDGHCRNMMSADFDELGVGYAFVESSPFGHYWTQNFGRMQ